MSSYLPSAHRVFKAAFTLPQKNCKQHCVPAEHLNQWIASTEMDMDEKLKHPNASVLLKPKPELAYFLDFDSNTQNRICGQQRLHGRKETNDLHKILSKYQASAQQQRRMNKQKIPSWNLFVQSLKTFAGTQILLRASK